MSRRSILYIVASLFFLQAIGFIVITGLSKKLWLLKVMILVYPAIHAKPSSTTQSKAFMTK